MGVVIIPVEPEAKGVGSRFRPTINHMERRLAEKSG